MPDARVMIKNYHSQCMEICGESHRICMETATYCLEQPDHPASEALINMLFDCAELCHTSVSFLLNDPNPHPSVYALCAQVSLKCAQACEELALDDPRMMECAEACRRCAESCQRMEAELSVYTTFLPLQMIS